MLSQLSESVVRAIALSLFVAVPAFAHAVTTPQPVVAEPTDWASFPQAISSGENCDGMLTFVNSSDQARSFTWLVGVFAASFLGGTPQEHVVPEMVGTVEVVAGQTLNLPIFVSTEAIALSGASMLVINASATFGEGDDDIFLKSARVAMTEPQLTVEVTRRATHISGSATIRIRSVEPLAAPITNASLEITMTEEKGWLAPNQTSITYPLGTLAAGYVIDTSVFLRSPFPGSDVVRAELKGMGIFWVEFSEEVLISGCAGDFDDGGDVTTGDIFAFLSAFFVESALPCQWGRIADVNADGCVTVGDLFDFLANYFAMCQPE